MRIIAATNADLPCKVQNAQFREDLFYRLAAFPISLPPLCQRREDIVPIARYFLHNLAAHAAAATPRLSEEATRALEARSWRGNVRELQHGIERALILCGDDSEILPEHLSFTDFETARCEPANRRVF